MQQQTYNLIELIADEGKVFDWANLADHTSEETDPETGEIKVTVEHLYATQIFLGDGDSADNYVEIDAPTEEE